MTQISEKKERIVGRFVYRKNFYRDEENIG